MIFFTKDRELDCILLYNFLDYELQGSKSGTGRKDMFYKAYKKREDDGSYSITIGHTFRKYISQTKNREPSKVFKSLYETTILTEKPYLMDYLKAVRDIYFPDFDFTEVQINYNWKSPPHFDKANHGDSIIIGLGDYTGGELMIEKEDGNVLSVDIHDYAFKFDGSKYKHWTNDYTGNRMSIVFYNLKDKKIDE